ncbi:hypothetical protein [Fusibacter ferrireducens]|uniref:Uncharacterized protein n=1 Tax=Fusibacter ferrireducens TaxID=2785058 RepID=A0ABR9ZNG7_9FIRM|nr:hypothetical protein [Fusibacter ferrireducens]MBF4692015.1 hypothetical protein [Fusibacter ferrireducens]
MNYKNILMGVLFYIVVSGIEESFSLKSYSLLIPLTIVVILLVSVKLKMKKHSE